MRKKEIRELVASVVGCGLDKVWQTPEMWLESENTTTQAMHIMWGYIQDKLNKRTKHGNKKQSAGKAAAC
jgi:ribosomal protein L19E